MPYLNFDLDYFDHPKTRRLIGLLGRGASELPIRLWCYCGKYHTESGDLDGYSAQEIESIVGWWGKQGEAVRAMIKVGFLVEAEGGYIVHDWGDHEGHLAAFQKRAKSAARARWGNMSNASSNACVDVKQSPLPNHTVPTVPTKKDTVSRPRTENMKTLKNAEFILRLHPDEFERWKRSISAGINLLNSGRNGSAFRWDEKTGGFESDLRKLVYSSFNDDQKKEILIQAYSLLGGLLNWPNYVEHAIAYTVQASWKTPIKSAYAFTVRMLGMPVKLEAEKKEGRY